MKITKQDSLLILSDAPTARSVPFGQCFSYDGKTLMRLKPTSFLLNSTLVADVLNRADVLVANMETGTLYIMEGSKEVKFCNASLVVVED